MSASTPATRKRPAAVVILTLLGLAALGAGLWWFGPWNEENRYRGAPLLSLKQTVDANPKNRKAARQLALRLADTGDPALAEPALRNALELDPTDPEVGTGLGELLQVTGRTPEAFQVLKATVGHHPEFPLARMALGRLYKQKGSYHHAAEQFQAAIDADKNFTDAWYELAICNLQMQKGAQARAAIAEAIRQAPNEAQYLALKSSVDAVVGATDEGIETARKAAELAPNDAKVQINYANILLAHYRGEEDLMKAEQVIARLEKVDPRLRILPYQRGELERRRKNWPAAQKYLEQAVQRTPYMDEAYFSLSQVYQRVGKKKEADRVLAYYRRRQYLRQEINAVGLSLSERPNDVNLHLRLARLNIEAGERNTAIGTLQNALQVDPKSAEARSLLEKLTAEAEAQRKPVSDVDHSAHDHSAPPPSGAGTP
jgi:tetratricopeptide (TPR) repeat protein